MQPELIAHIEKALKTAQGERDRVMDRGPMPSTKIHEASLTIMYLQGALLHARAFLRAEN